MKNKNNDLTIKNVKEKNSKVTMTFKIKIDLDWNQDLAGKNLESGYCLLDKYTVKNHESLAEAVAFNLHSRIEEDIVIDSVQISDECNDEYKRLRLYILDKNKADTKRRLANLKEEQRRLEKELNK